MLFGITYIILSFMGCIFTFNSTSAHGVGRTDFIDATSFYFVAIGFSDFNVSGLFRCFSER